MRDSRAFSLVEVVVALAIVVFALIIMLALIPVGLTAAANANNDTRSSMIAQDSALRLRAIPISVEGAGTPLPKLTTNWWYDANGRYLGTNYTTAVYRVDTVRGPLNTYPVNTNPASQDTANTYSTQLEAATVNIGSPVNTANGALVLPPATTNTYTFYLRVVPNL